MIILIYFIEVEFLFTCIFNIRFYEEISGTVVCSICEFAGYLSQVGMMNVLPCDVRVSLAASLAPCLAPSLVGMGPP